MCKTFLSASWLLVAGLAGGAAAQSLPPPPHPIAYGYYGVDERRYGDFRSLVNCYTDIYYAWVQRGYEYDVAANEPVAVWLPRMLASLDNAVAEGRRIVVNLELKEPKFMDQNTMELTTDSLTILNALAPYWDHIERIELADEPDWLKIQTEAAIGNLVAALADRDLENKPGFLGIVLTESQLFREHANATRAAGLGWVGIEAYLCGPDVPHCSGTRGSADPAATAQTLRTLLQQSIDKVPQDKDVIVVLQGYTQGHRWASYQAALTEMQYEGYRTAVTYRPERLRAVHVFHFGRGDGTRRHPNLAAAHRDIAAAIYGGPVPPVCGGAAPQPPLGLHVSKLEQGFADLRWSNGPVQPNYHRLFHREPPELEWGPWGDFIAGAATEVLDVVVPLPGIDNHGRTHCYKVTAYFGDGHPKESEEVCVTVYKNPPWGLPIPRQGEGCVNSTRPRIEWDPAPGATGYYVVASRLYGGPFVVDDMNVVETTYQMPPLEAGLRYAWKVKGCNNQGCNPQWTTYTFLTPLCRRRADFNGDGRNDLIFQDTATGDYSVWFMDGSQRVGSAPLVPSKPATTGWTLVGANDFNGDSKPDLVWRHTTSGNLAFWLMDGVTRVSGATLTGVSDAAWVVAGTADFGGNPGADLLWRHTGTGELHVWNLNGTAYVSSTVINGPVLGPAWTVVATGDVNGDTLPDVVFQNATTGELRYQVVENGWVFGEGGFTPAAPGDLAWQPLAFVDLDRNGSADMLWQHPASSRLVHWSMDGIGTTRSTGGFLSPDGSSTPSLRLVGPR